jgi:hypothetical protein
LKLTVRHRYDFGPVRRLVGSELSSPDSWDALRSGNDDSFSLPETREKWIDACGSAARARATAESLSRWIRREGHVNSLASYGVGVGCLELHLMQAVSGLRLVASEFAPATVAVLREVFREADVRQHDLLTDPPISGVDAHLLNRVETAFDDTQLRHIFERFSQERVLFMTTEVLNMKMAATELRARFNRQAVPAGWVRTRAALEDLWKPTHVAHAEPLIGGHFWILEPQD